MILLDNQTNISVDIKSLKKISADLSEKDIELIFIDATSMQEINKEHRGKDSTTDVLSFPMEDMPHTPLGSLLINIELADTKAKEFGHSFEDEITLLFIHGLLHLLGYDHEVDSGEMRKREEELIIEYNLPKSLIVRTEDN